MIVIMKNSIKFKIVPLIILILQLLSGCEKDKGNSGLPVDGDGNKYETVAIGTQTWLTENLKTTKYINGDPIPLVTDNSAWTDINRGAYCWYENNINYKEVYGALYNGYAAQTNDFICPTGYHVPILDEWMELVNYLEDAPEEAMLSFNINQIGWRVWNGSFNQHPSSWWIYASDGSSHKISVGFLISSMPENSGYYIRCIKDN
jgi:uncharacterized protein (TIGR02145 family)